MYPIIPPHIISVDVRKKNEIIHNLLNNMKLKQINVLAIMLATGGLILPSCKGNSNFLFYLLSIIYKRRDI